ncbi:MAG: AgmX/PglI C-terminal domain-containing protein [bacterium]
MNQEPQKQGYGKHTTAGPGMPSTESRSYITQIYVFKDEDYLGWDCFDKETISIGQSGNADLVLSGENIADIQALLYFKEGQIIVSDESRDGKLRVNGRYIKTFMLGPLDFITIGPYTLKIKIKEKVASEGEALPIEQYTQHERISSSRMPYKEASMLEAEGQSITAHPIMEESPPYDHGPQQHDTPTTPSEASFREQQVPIPDSVSNECHTTPACEIKEPVMETPDMPISEHTSHTPWQQKQEIVPEIQSSGPIIHEPDTQWPTFSVMEEDDEDEDDEDDIEGVFSLRGKFLDHRKSEDGPVKGEIMLEVAKFRGDRVIDVTYLHKKQKYYCRVEKGRFCLAEYKNSHECYFYFNDQFKGSVHSSTSPQLGTDQLLNITNLYNRRKNIYRDLLPDDGDACISDGYYEYFLRRVTQGQSPYIPDPPKIKNKFPKILLQSALFHLAVVFIAGFLVSLPKMPDPSQPESRFVKIDTRKLSEIKKQPPPIKKPKKRTEVKTASKKVKTAPKKVKTARKKIKTQPKPQKSASLKLRPKTNQPRSRTRKGRISRSPRAGGGSGKGGNVLNRNVNQVGLLGAIGMSDGVGIKAKEALAAVTNLDAVKSSHASEGTLKVGGIVGKLGNGQIEIPKAGLVSTKGSSQALRSAGVKGKGSVAALAKGRTGQKQVKGMVSAKLNRSVNIQGGGMSREAVKRIIDQHLDEISYCYESALIADPSIMGKIVYEWKILLSGKVGEIRIKTSSIKSSDIHSCIKQAIKSWQFPKPRGSEVIVSYPFIFDIVGF